MGSNNIDKSKKATETILLFIMVELSVFDMIILFPEYEYVVLLVIVNATGKKVCLNNKNKITLIIIDVQIKNNNIQIHFLVNLRSTYTYRVYTQL